jgi:hypothetical protein
VYIRISSSLSGGVGPYSPFPSSPEPDTADTLGLTIGASVRNPMDTVTLSTTFRDMKNQAARDAESAPKDQWNSVTGHPAGAPQSPADSTASALTCAENQELMKATPGVAEQVLKQEQNTAGGSVSITDLQSINLLTMMPGMLLTALRQNQSTQNSPAKGTKVDAIV